ncbi:MAG TPA: bifunctional phosphopantothenoylcysteine decarboxylase/phosphopantothenate--cysteine ligase CoaBC [Actinomycetota bacterium]|nr:bifunctional phosphopantothenoylcysteine decarboxylase/phosphopantothenate--cysteine ligase CoaBC [Actinomycetota bacterium]
MASPLAGRRVLLGVTGGIAAYKAAYLARLLRERGAEVQVVMTPSALRFVGADTFAALTGRPVHSEVFERTEAVLHVRLAREADVAVVAPATANALARMAGGLADDLLTSTLLEVTGPVVVAPAMHVGMWGNPATRANLATLRERGVTVVGPVEGPLAAGDEGMGRMAEPEDIAAAVERAASEHAGPLAGRRVLVTAGPTHEPIDAVRFIGNRSSGKMGFAVAREAARRGAAVTLVAGPTHLSDPPGVEVVRVETAEEMRDVVLARLDDADAVVKAAAVADWRPKETAEGKLKKDAGAPEILLEPTPDILRELGERKGERVLVGFAAETEDLEAAGREKLRSKHLDVVVVNEVGRPGTGFEADTNRAMILSADGRDEPLREWTKADLAAAICDRLEWLLA